MRFDKYVPAVKSGGFGAKMRASMIKNNFQKGSEDDSVRFVLVDKGTEAFVNSVIVKSYNTMNLRFCALVILDQAVLRNAGGLLMLTFVKNCSASVQSVSVYSMWFGIT